MFFLSVMIWECEENIKGQSWSDWHTSFLSHWPLLVHRVKIQSNQLIDLDGKSLVHAILYHMYQRSPASLQFYLKMPTTAPLLPLKLEDLEKGSMVPLHGVFIPHRPFYTQQKKHNSIWEDSGRRQEMGFLTDNNGDNSFRCQEWMNEFFRANRFE